MRDYLGFLDGERRFLATFLRVGDVLALRLVCWPSVRGVNPTPPPLLKT